MLSQFKNYRTNKDSDWKILGPGLGGAVFMPAMSPFDTDTMMVSSDMTGTYITHNAGKTWEEINLKSRVDSIAFDPGTEGTIYAGSSGLYCSVDNGTEWNLIFPDPSKVKDEKYFGDEAAHFFITEDNWPGGKIIAIRVDPDNSGRIVIGIGVGTSISYDASDLVIFTSEDRGLTWSETGHVSGTWIRSIFIESAALSAESADRKMYVITDDGVFVSDAEGKTPLVKVNSIGLKNKIITASIGLNPDTNKLVFFATTSTRYEDGKMISGITRSDDYGLTWKELNNGLDADYYGPGKSIDRSFRCVAVSESDARVVYTGVWRNLDYFLDPSPEMSYCGVMMSADMGESWHWSVKIGDTLPDNYIPGWQEIAFNTDWTNGIFGFIVHPKDSNISMYTVYQGLYRSDDGGKTWEQRYCELFEDGTTYGHNIEVTGVHDVAFDPFDKDHIVFPYTDIGMMQSYNGGNTWVSAVHQGVPFDWMNTCYAMVFDPDVRGRAWAAFSGAHDLPRTKLFRNNILDTYPYRGGVCKSMDGVKSWFASNFGLPMKCITTSIILDKNSPIGQRTLYITACRDGVYKSEDDGRSWTLKNNGLSGNLYSWKILERQDGTLFLINMRALKDGKVVGGTVYRSSDKAESWQQVELPAGVNAPVDIGFDPDDVSRIYLTCWPDEADAAERHGGMYVTTDDCRTWKKTFSDAEYVYSVSVYDDIIYVGTFENAVFWSDDKGSTWNRLKGYDFKWTYRVVKDIHNEGMLYVTTFGNSCWYGPHK